MNLMNWIKLWKQWFNLYTKPRLLQVWRKQGLELRLAVTAADSWIFGTIFPLFIEWTFRKILFKADGLSYKGTLACFNRPFDFVVKHLTAAGELTKENGIALATNGLREIALSSAVQVFWVHCGFLNNRLSIYALVFGSRLWLKNKVKS